MKKWIQAVSLTLNPDMNLFSIYEECNAVGHLKSDMSRRWAMSNAHLNVIHARIRWNNSCRPCWSSMHTHQKTSIEVVHHHNIYNCIFRNVLDEGECPNYLHRVLPLCLALPTTWLKSFGWRLEPLNAIVFMFAFVSFIYIFAFRCF